MLLDPGMRAAAIALLSLALSTTFAVAEGNAHGRDNNDDDDRWHKPEDRDPQPGSPERPSSTVA